jgi:hypothetical protein
VFDSATTSLLKAVLDEVCAQIPPSDTSLRTHVASKILECARNGECSIEELQNAGQRALRARPTMWWSA